MKAKFFLLPAFLVLLCLPAYVSAQSSTTHTIQKGETLFSIAQKYGVSVAQLKSWNRVDADDLSVGQSIVIRPGATDTSRAPEGMQTHTVEAGETLFSISKQYHVTIAELKSWNNLSSNNLRVGETLKVYPSASPDTPDQSITVDTETQQNAYYTVKNNDSLYKIARAHNMTVNELKRLNNLSSNTIRVGQELTVRADARPPSVSSASTSSPQGQFISYRVESGNATIADVAAKFQMDAEEVKALNPDIQADQLRRGQQLTVLTPASKSFNNPYVKNSTSMSSLGSVSVSHYAADAKATPTTNGELYNPEALTGAHASIALGSVIFVKNPEYAHGVFVRINDRISGNGLKLSTAAWKALHFTGPDASATIYQH